MKYAESLLLGGQLIDAKDVDPNNYQELLCVCPHCKSRVYLADSEEMEFVHLDFFPAYQYWKHLETRPGIPPEKCRMLNSHYQMVAEEKNKAAARKRLDLLKPNLWNLILSSAILDNSQDHLDNYGSDEDRLMMWFDLHFLSLCTNPLYQARIKQECKNLYNLCIKKTIEDGNNQSFEKIAEIYSNHNHIVYGQQIASEVLEFVLQTWKADDIRKLIYLAVNQELCEQARKLAYVMSGVVKGLLKKQLSNQFMDLWTQDEYSGMNRILEVVTELPDLDKAFRSDLAKIDTMFTLNLCLIFSCVPWIDELKKTIKS